MKQGEKMSYKTIEYTVYDDKIVPNTLQSGGVAGDDNAVRVKFNLSNITLGANDKVRIEISNGVGGFNSSEHLTVSGGNVYYDLPLDVTSSGGTAVMHLVITNVKDNVEQSVKYSYPAKIYFEESGYSSISYKQYKQGLSGLALECKSYMDSAQTASDDADSAAATANQYLTGAQMSQSAAETAAAAAKASADSAANVVSTHNTAKDAHENRFSIIQSQLNEKVPTGYVTGAIADHNTSDNAHGALFGTLRTRVDGLDGGLAAAVTKLNAMQTHPCYEYSASGGNVQRFDDVSEIVHNIGITVHGATDSDSRTVTNPKVNVYGKNLFKFASLTASGYTFSGSRCKIVNPTSAYHYCNGTEFMLNPGTYTYSCTVSGEVEYTASNAFRTFYEFNGTQYTLNMDGFGGGTQKYSATFIVTAPTTFKFKHVWFYGMPASANLSMDFQLEVGNSATDYEPYIEVQTASPQTSFAEGEVFKIDTFTAVSPTMTVVARDDNNLISTVDVTYNRDIGKALAAMS